MAVNVSALSSDLNNFGGKIFKKKVTNPDWKEHVMVLPNVVVPVTLPRIHTTGTPRPYRTQRDTSGNAVVFTDRVLTVNQSKWDMPDMDPEVFRNTYLADVAAGRINPKTFPFYEAIANKIVEDYNSKINDSVLWLGDYDASGTDVSDIANGFGTIIADEITATNLTPIATGAIAATDAVTKFETFYDGLPTWMKQQGCKLLVSHALFAKYRKHYRTLNGFGFDPGAKSYTIDSTRAQIHAASFIPDSSSRILAVPLEEKVLYAGTDISRVELHTTPHVNLIELRAMYPFGLQIADLDAIAVNDQA